jgi:hypothetical protein
MDIPKDMSHETTFTKHPVPCCSSTRCKATIKALTSVSILDHGIQKNAKDRFVEMKPPESQSLQRSPKGGNRNKEQRPPVPQFCFVVVVLLKQETLKQMQARTKQ